jgi:hypothetical protein
MPKGIYTHKRGVYHHSEQTKEKIGKSNSVALKGYHPVTEFKVGTSQETAPAWKDTEVSYRAIHYRIESRFGKAMHCEECGMQGLSRYHWSNISGQYKLDRNDWQQLCPKCHKQFDLERIKQCV